MTEEPEEQPPEPKERPRRWLFWLRAVWLVALTPVIFVLVAAIMLIEQDIDAPSWIVERVEARAAEVLGGGDLRFGAIALHIGSDLHPTIRLRDVQLRDASGTLISQIPQADGLMSPRGLILRREVLIQEVRITGMQINLARAADGSVAVAFGDGARSAGEAPSLVALLDQFDTVLERDPFEALESVEATGLIVNFDDARARRSWLMDGGSLSLERRSDTNVLRGNFAILSGGADVTTASLSYTSARGSLAAQFAVDIDNVLASDIAAQSPGLRWLQNIEAPLSAALRTTLDAEGALGPLNATLEIGQGALRPNAATEPVRFEQAKTYLSYDPARDRIAFREIAVETEWGQFQGSGDAYLREFVDGLPQALLAQIDLRQIGVNPAELYAKALEIDRAAADIRVRFAPFSIDIGQLVINDGPSRLISHGEIVATDRGWQLALDSALDQITPEQLLEYWPVSFRPGTRLWFANNLSEGKLVNGYAGLRIFPGEPPKLASNIGFEGSQVQFMRTIPPIRDATGTVFIQNNAMTVGLDEGILAAPQGGELALAGSVFTIPILGIPDPPALIDLKIASSVTAILSVLNRPPFTFMDKANLPVTLVDGRAEVNGRITLPLKPRIPRDDIVYDFTADIARAQSSVLVPNRTLTASRVALRVDNDGIAVEGPVAVDGLPVDVIWQRALGPGTSGSQVRGQIELSPQFLETFGIGLPPGTMAGRGTGALQIDLTPDGPPTFSLRSDLRGLRVSLAAVGWSKGPNTAGELLLEGRLGPVPRVTNLLISGGGLRAQGRVDLDANGQLASATFDRVSVDDWLDAPITLRGRGRGVPVAVEIDGGTIDLRQARFGGQGEGGPVTIALDRLQVAQGIALTSFRGDFNGAGGFSGRFSAQLNGGPALKGTVAPRNGRSAVQLTSDDAGGVVRAAGFMRNGLGGSLQLTLLPTGGAGTFDGFLAVRGIRVTDAPTMAALLDAISVVGLLQQLDGQGLSFDEVDARFRLTPQQVVITQASAVGPGLGISVDGLYTLATKQLDLQGVVSPFYLVNSIGSFLTRRGEGLIGFNFNIGGTADRPQVSVNPLSAFTPGMFREIFRRPPPTVTQ